MTEDTAPLPLDAADPPPRKRGLGRGLDDLQHAGRSIGADGQPYYGLDALMWAIDGAHRRRLAERTAQPAALHRLPEPQDTGPINVAAIIAATPPPAKPKTLSESAAILNRALAHPSEAIRVERPTVVVATPEPPTEKRSKWDFLDET